MFQSPDLALKAFSLAIIRKGVFLEKEDLCVFLFLSLLEELDGLIKLLLLDQKSINFLVFLHHL